MNLANAIMLVAFLYLRLSHDGSSSTTWLSFFVRAQCAGLISDIYTRIIALTQTSSTPLHGMNSTHTSLKPSVPDLTTTVVPVGGDVRQKRRVLHVRPYPVDLNGTAKENTEAAGSSMCRRNFGGVGGWWVEGGRRCGVGHVIREARVFWRMLKMQCGDRVLGDQRQSGGDGWVNGGNRIL
jgi:hypothetical protein